MVLVDTSVWIRFLKGHQPYLTELQRLLELNQALGHELVFGELLAGDPGGRLPLFDDYARIEHIPIVPHAEVVTFVRSRRLFGRGVGWIDIHLLASAIASKVKFWTADRDLAALASELGVAYDLDGIKALHKR